MNDEANPRSLAFQMKDLSEHCQALSSMPSGAGWPVADKSAWRKRLPNLFDADVTTLCQPSRRRLPAMQLDRLLAAMDAALPAFSDAITHTYFSHAEMERAT